MIQLTILGAGYMGSALAMVAAKAGHAVRLWGTWLDHDLVHPAQQGEPHPRLKLKLPPSIRIFDSPQLQPALSGSDAVVCAVNSDGVLAVLEQALPFMAAGAPLLSITKGFLHDAQGRIQRISQVVRQSLLEPAGLQCPFVHIGGPCKAMEVARDVPTAVIYAAEDRDVAARCAAWLEGSTYTITVSDDLAGAEVCAAFKNAYATASGICDGLEARGLPEMYNTKALLFSQAICEITKMVQALGGRAQTAQGIAAVGDLHVTAAAGRNRTYGEHVGRGEPPDQVAAQMRQRGELTEGYPALRTGWELLQQVSARGALQVADFPLLQALHRIVYQGADPAQTLLSVQVRG